tara:strand:+ start:72 stop:260 length:189 start_codon:yes stop_codon:yes gene_type:complete
MKISRVPQNFYFVEKDGKVLPTVLTSRKEARDEKVQLSTSYQSSNFRIVQRAVLLGEPVSVR